MNQSWFFIKTFDSSVNLLYRLEALPTWSVRTVDTNIIRGPRSVY